MTSENIFTYFLPWNEASYTDNKVISGWIFKYEELLFESYL